MKKLISLAMALAMTVSLVPATAFAASTSTVSNVVTVEDDTTLANNVSTYKEAPVLTLEADKDFKRTENTFRLKLENAEWNWDESAAGVKFDKTAFNISDVAQVNPTTPASIEVKKWDKTTATVTLVGVVEDGDTVSVPMLTNVSGGNATVTVVPLESEFTAETKTFAKTTEGSTSTTISKTTKFYDGGQIEPVIIEEVTAGTIPAGTKITMKLNSGFAFNGTPTVVAVEGSASITTALPKEETFEFTVNSRGSKALALKIDSIKISEDGASVNSTAKITVKGSSGSNVTTQTIEVGTLVDFGVTLTPKKADLPVIYAGVAANSTNENEALTVVLEETVVNSIIAGRKVTLELPDGVEFVADSASAKSPADVQDYKATGFDTTPSSSDLLQVKPDGASKITIDMTDGGMPKQAEDKTRKIEVTFRISAAADFTGDVVLKLAGPGVSNEEIKATIATIKAPMTVKTGVNEVKIDYRNTEISDIVITEAEAGLWTKGDVITLQAENMKFESGMTAKVTSGDMTLEKGDGDLLTVDKTAGTVSFKVKNESAKDPAEVTISGVKLYLDRTLPVGDYKLSVIEGGKAADNKTIFTNYDKAGDDRSGSFDCGSVTMLKDFVKVVTAGRDQNDTLFTTKLVVPVGADYIMAGTKEIKIDAPAYINKDGYTMLPVRAVSEALNGLAAIKWDDATKTATIAFGNRMISMTVGSKIMNINGVATAILAAPEIKAERIFLPLRDLGYALGLTDNKIVWDAATSTATLN